MPVWYNRLMENNQTNEMQPKKKINKAFVFAACVTCGLIAAIGFTTVGLSSSLGNLSEEISMTKADVILANADIEDETTVSVPILYFDQVADECVNMYETSLQSALNERQFEWTKCGYINYAVEPGMVNVKLGVDYLPVAEGGILTANKGVKDEGFKRWFSAVDGKSKNIPSVLNLTYSEIGSTFDYENEKFYPVDGLGFKDVDEDGHNHLFTLSLGIPFRVLKSDEQLFEITADDDTWVYVDNKLVLDMGGIHEPVRGALRIAENGEVETSVGDEVFAYSGTTIAGDSAIIRVFHADRDSKESVFKMHFEGMVLNMTNATLAKNGDGVTVAYDPTDPTYVAPLGESMTFGADHSRSMLMASIIQASVLGMLAVVLIAVISIVMKTKKREA